MILQLNCIDYMQKILPTPASTHYGIAFNF